MKKGIYLLPHLFTSANLLCGFLSMIAVSNGQYTRAALAILIAVGLDCLDGKVARLTNSASAFGVEYDSLADLLSFGMAPGWLLYDWLLRPFGLFGGVAAFLFVICGALRLARFNVQAAGVQKYTFTGLPIPMAASVIASAVLLGQQIAGDMPIVEPDHPIGFVLAIYGLAFLMVSKFRYRSFKRVHIKRAWSFPLLLGGGGTLIVFALIPEISLFVFFLSYALSGPVETLLRRKKPKENVLPAEQ
jgi:CDP-diacylglycerol--serine O-phosphatidyltransferase